MDEVEHTSGQRLPLGVEPGEHRLRVHLRLDQFDRHVPLDRVDRRVLKAPGPPSD
jgi:hypothetical protein